MGCMNGYVQFTYIFCKIVKDYNFFAFTCHFFIDFRIQPNQFFSKPKYNISYTRTSLIELQYLIHRMFESLKYKFYI